MAFRTTPVFFASLTISLILACAAADRPFGRMTIVRSLVKFPGTIFAGERFKTSSMLLALAAQTSASPLLSAATDLPPVRRTSRADFKVRLRNWSDEVLSPAPTLTPADRLERHWQTRVRVRQ